MHMSKYSTLGYYHKALTFCPLEVCTQYVVDLVLSLGIPVRVLAIVLWKALC